MNGKYQNLSITVPEVSILYCISIFLIISFESESRGRLMCEAPSSILEVKRRECHAQFKQCTLYLGLKLKGGSVVCSLNHTQVDLCSDGLKARDQKNQ